MKPVGYDMHHTIAFFDDDGEWSDSVCQSPCGFRGKRLPDDAREHMRRLEASWNACRNMSIEEIERKADEL